MLGVDQAQQVASHRSYWMIDKGYVEHFARYNRWQNECLFSVVDALADQDRRRERGAFFGSIHATLNHLLWGDRMWMSRFAATPPPEGGIPQSVSLRENWSDLKCDRFELDATIIRWADGLNPTWLEGELTWYSGAAKQNLTKPKSVLLLHFFNHQTHHRGQVHCMLTQAGVKAHVTDLMLMPISN
jgi:uncharacterized damage-inducible protein DinB